MRKYNPSIPTDQATEYRTSAHGQRYGKGDAQVATCVSCHGNHQVRSANDVKSKVFPVNLPTTCGTCHGDEALMKKYGRSSSTLHDYTGSVHGVALLEKRDLGAPACNDCHGNHGARPPGVESITNVCGTCHALNAELYAQSPHQNAFEKRKLPECETCHGNHAIIAATNNLIGTAPEAVCSKCHSASENVRGFEVAGHMRAKIDSLESSEGLARSLVDEAEQKGMEISEAKFRLRDVRQSRLRSRTTIHSFDEAKFAEIIDVGLTSAKEIQVTANSQIEEFSFRRQGFGIASFIITFLAVTLYLYIRRLERRQASETLKH
jgi:predicted CXXCH cytochrome family protein